MWESSSTCEGLGWDSTNASCPPCIKHIVSILGCIEYCNIYYKDVDNDDKLKCKVLTANGEAQKPYAALTVASMSSTSTIGLCEYGVSWNTSYIFIHINY